MRERIHEREQQKWRKNCLLKPKLRTYVKIKKTLRTEPYLTVYHRRGIPELVKLRGGTNRLRIEQGRYRQEALEDRVCEYCDSLFSRFFVLGGYLSLIRLVEPISN